MSEKKTLLITPDFPPMKGGVARYLSALALYLQDDVEVVAMPHHLWQSFDPSAGYPIYRRQLLSSWGPGRWRESVKYLKAYKDRYRLILTSHVLPYGTAAMVAGRKTKTPYIVFVHGMDIRLAQTSARKRALARKVLRSARLVVCNSQALAREVSRVFGVTEILVVYPCLASTAIPLQEPALGSEDQAPREAPSTQTVQATDTTMNFLTVARLVERKGHAHVLNALSNLRGSGRLMNFQYHIVGEGPMRETLEEMTRALSLSSHITFHGEVDDVTLQSLYAGADVFVMPVSLDPLDKEGFGLSFIEAAAHGVPSVTTNIEGVDEAVIDDQTGLLLPDQDEESLAEVLLTLATNKELRDRLGTGAREHAKTFTCKKQFEKLRPYLV